MADYKELLRKAVEALPENNGAARRAVYEKARAALVGQLRAINPPLPARDITTHRLQLEDCIRQVEQEASEANLSGLSSEPETPPTLPPVFAGDAKPRPPRNNAEARAAADSPRPPAARGEPVRFDVPAEPPRAEAPRSPAARNGAGKGGMPARAAARPQPKAASIEDIIAEADSVPEAPRDDLPAAPAPRSPELKPRQGKPQPVLVARTDAPRRAPEPEPEPEVRAEPRRPAAQAENNNRPLPAIVARAEAAKRGVMPEPSRRTAAAAEPRRGAAAARQMQPLAYDLSDDVEAMSTVREVDLDNAPDPQGAIDRAIATLETEARGRVNGYDDDEADERPVRRNGAAKGRSADAPNMRGEREGRDSRDRDGRDRDRGSPRAARDFATPRRTNGRGNERGRQDRGGLSAMVIFAIIFGVLLVGAGGGGLWAWQQGWLDSMFGKGAPAVAAATADTNAAGNTEAAANTAEATTQLKADQRLPTSDTPAADASSAAPLALQAPAGKTEARLGADDSAGGTAAEAVAAIDPASVAGSQSLLLEAADSGGTGATPFSGTVEWSKGVDELGQPTLIAKASIPARNLSVDVLIRKNGDPSLPASHLMEINFTVSDTFVGGSIAGLPGVLLKNEELVQGAPLVGASARVVGNSFLFALSAAQEDANANVNLLTSRKWMDLALIYASGKRAIITLEKDDNAQLMFNDVFTAWSKSAKG